MADGSAIPSDTCTWGTVEDFVPPRWLRNPHLQSIVPALPLRRPHVLRGCREVVTASRSTIVDCGNGARLLAYHAVPCSPSGRASRRMAVLLHGWESSANSPDVVSLAQHLYETGFEVVRLNLRDHGDTEHLNPGLFHSCRLAELVGAVRNLQRRSRCEELNLVGFSLGGNFALRVGAQARAEGLQLAHIVAVCPVIDSAHALTQLDTGPLVYRSYFINRWRRSLRRKSAAWPNRYDFRELLRMQSLTEMTEHFLRRFTDYRSIDHYLNGYTLVGDALGRLDVDSRLIAATDDPILSVDDVARLPPSPKLRITLTTFGGHCGFYEGSRGPSWLERSIARTLCGP